jgi:3-hydroxyacyl-[acyl-carrier-protein] dehydratase
MLKDDFFTITAMIQEDNSCKAMLELNARHEIFGGHFPGHPVVPGACMMQMIKEMSEMVIRGKLQLIKADHLKFLAPVDPNESRVLEMLLSYNIKEDDTITVSANLLKNGRICFKFSGLFRSL